MLCLSFPAVWVHLVAVESNADVPQAAVAVAQLAAADVGSPPSSAAVAPPARALAE